MYLEELEETTVYSIVYYKEATLFGYSHQRRLRPSAAFQWVKIFNCVLFWSRSLVLEVHPGGAKVRIKYHQGWIYRQDELGCLKMEDA